MKGQDCASLLSAPRIFRELMPSLCLRPLGPGPRQGHGPWTRPSWRPFPRTLFKFSLHIHALDAQIQVSSAAAAATDAAMVVAKVVADMEAATVVTVTGAAMVATVQLRSWGKARGQRALTYYRKLNLCMQICHRCAYHDSVLHLGSDMDRTLLAVAALEWLVTFLILKSLPPELLSEGHLVHPGRTGMTATDLISCKTLGAWTGRSRICGDRERQATALQ